MILVAKARPFVAGLVRAHLVALGPHSGANKHLNLAEVGARTPPLGAIADPGRGRAADGASAPQIPAGAEASPEAPHRPNGDEGARPVRPPPQIATGAAGGRDGPTVAEPSGGANGALMLAAAPAVANDEPGANRPPSGANAAENGAERAR